jgi:hypothetical protein
VLNGRHREALAILEKIPADRRGPLDRYVRAICHYQLGNVDDADRELAAARAAHKLSGLDVKPYAADELRRMREEAERVLRSPPLRQ